MSTFQTFFAHASVIAAIVWGPTGCQAPVQAHLTALPRTVLGQSADPCNILYNRRKRWPWWLECTVTIHEWGHLTNHGHSRNPISIMYPILNHEDDRCKDYGRPYLRLHKA